jgi:hypothetical protein
MVRPCSTHGKTRNEYMTLLRKPERNRSLGRPRRRWLYNIKMGLEKYDGVSWTGLIWLRRGRAFMYTVSENSSVAAQLVASEEGLSCMELVRLVHNYVLGEEQASDRKLQVFCYISIMFKRSCLRQQIALGEILKCTYCSTVVC